MKKLKQIFTQVKAGDTATPDEFTALLWQLICYSPKMPVRLQQQQLLDEAQTFCLKVTDNYFALAELHFNGFTWGNSKCKLLITHGWGSKAADFYDLIIALKTIKDIQIIAFDAPGNGSSAGELSNLLLYTDAVKAVIAHFGAPDIMIGHSLGAMANIIAIQQTQAHPRLLVSLTPLIRLKENFEASMDAADVPAEAQRIFFKSFEKRFGTPALQFNLMEIYPLAGQLNHWLAYDHDDQVSPSIFINEFLNKYPSIKSQAYNGTGHDKIIRSPQVINDLLVLVKSLSPY